MKSIHFIISAAAVLLVAGATSQARDFDHSHKALTEVLETHVHGARVDYPALKQSPDKLNGYLDTLAAVTRSEYDAWNREQQMAFLINIYNAATLKLIIDNYPVSGIRRIGGLFGLGSPWKMDIVRMFGEKVTLDHVEHEVLRPDFKEPRIHFAVNCASIGCPDLRKEAFRAADLENQLEEQTKAFLRDRTRNRLDIENRTLHLSRIFDWYEEDFVEASGSVANFVAPYFTERERAFIEQGDIRIRHTRYDWDLNDR